MLTKVERFTVKIRLCVGRGIGPLTIAPVAFTVLTIFSADLSTAQNRGEDPSKLYSPEELAKWEAGTEPGYKSYDYYDMVMRKNVPQYHINANVTGGSEKTNYYLSVAHTGQDAMMRDFKYERTNLQLNIDTKITDRFTIGAQISGKYEKTEDVGLPGGDGYYSAILSMFKMQPIESPYANDNPPS